MFEEEEGWDYQLELTQKTDDSPLGRLLEGAYDMHLHFEPEPWMGRRFDALETALHARDMGLEESHVLHSAPCPACATPCAGC
jgi:hypothetical protein